MSENGSAFNRSQLTPRSPEKCVICDQVVTGTKATPCQGCNVKIHDGCRDSSSKNGYCPECLEKKSRASTSAGSRTASKEKCFKCKKHSLKIDCKEFEHNHTSVFVCKACLKIMQQKREVAEAKAVELEKALADEETRKSVEQAEAAAAGQTKKTATVATKITAEVVTEKSKLASERETAGKTPSVNNNKATSKRSSIGSKSSAKRKELEEEQKALKQTMEACLRRLDELEKKKKEIPSESSSSRKSEISLSDTEILNKTNEWVDKLVKPGPSKVQFSELPFVPSTSNAQPTALTRDMRSSTPAPWFEARTFEQFSNSLREPITERSQSWERHATRLTPDQVYSRQVIPKELPAFSGDPQDWPIFISSFVISTKRCGYSDEENVLRLRQALRGSALDAVKTQLRFPEMLVETLNTLRIKYGRPDQILDSILERIHKAPALQTDNLEQLIDFSLLVRDLYATIKASKMEEHLRNPMLLRELVGKLSGTLQLQWGAFKRSAGTEDVYTFGQWIFDIADIASELPGSRRNTIKSSSQSNDVSRNQGNRTGGRVYAIAEKKTTTRGQCPVCEMPHETSACPTFLVKSPNEKWSLVIKLSLCGKCLKQHNFRFCRSRKKCGVKGCKRTHHPLIHREFENEPTAGTKESQVDDTICTHRHETSNVLFRILPVRMFGKGGKELTTYAFLDEGSSVTLMDQELADLLELDGPVESLCLRWTGETSREEPSSRRVAFQIAGDGRRYTMSNVRTVRQLNLQAQSLEFSKIAKNLKHLRGLPVQEYQNAVPRILIGLPHWNLALALDTRDDENSGIMATKSRLGWAVSGRLGDTMVEESVNAHACDCMNKDDTLHNIVKDFFSLENFGVRSSEMVHISKQDERATQILNNTTRYNEGRYELGLLWRFEKISLPPSRQMALRRMVCLEKKLRSSPNLYENIRRQIREYVEKGYARRLTKEEELNRTSRTWYLPLFTVCNPNKPEKIRLVWDAAARVQNTSLNENLLTGPDYLTPLTDVLRKFRQYKWAVTGDIKEMFHQIRIRKDDQDSQRFLWRDTPDEEPGTYVMSVMTFGATCSPCAAQYIKNYNAMKFEKVYPRAAKAIIENHYVDDYADSFPTLTDASTVTKEVLWIHAQAGFELRNFASNSKDLLQAINEKERTEAKNLDNSPTNQAKVLGMFWHPIPDKLVFKVNFDRMDPELLNGTRRPTKREVLRILMMVFDPLGLIANVLVLAKILLQEVWRTNVGWDEPISTEQTKKWNTWVMMLQKLNNVDVPRCYHPDLSNNGAKIELHIFVDASQNAYAAVAYFRIQFDGRVSCTLVGAKTKVAPQKLLSIPRLELQAAVLGTRLAKSIADSHTFSISNRTFWSDSMNVLGWISSDARRYKPFVAFRISEILDTSNTTEWRYVPTKVNIADTATKWRSDMSEVMRSDWVYGPLFLGHPEEKWPMRSNLPEPPELGEERRVTEDLNVHISPKVMETAEPTRVSRWRTLIGAQATFRRVYNQLMLIIRNVGNTAPFPYGLTHEELSDAEKVIISRAQNDWYFKEINSLEAGCCLSETSPITPLSPFLDDDGLLRMKSRISVFKFQSGSPIILPREHKVTHLIIDHYHRKFYHRNNETVVNEIRQVYWIPKLRAALKAVIKQCTHCKKRRSKPITPMMADLPEMRLATDSRPFTFTGLDYFGPMEVVVGRRVEKRWVALFTCLTVRALHLETAHTLNADSAIMCVRRFIARRGLPAEIWSDNGTNFRRASLDLKEALQNLDQDRIVESFDMIKWKFICPAAPHMGGAWERLVRSVKCTLNDILYVRRPTDEQLLTLLAEVEHIVNSRPLTYVAIEVDAEEALTPNHLLLGSSSGAKSPGVFEDDQKIVRKRWIIVQQLADEFWRRWTKEYLPTIMRRTKWQTPSKAVTIGDIGVLYDGNQRNSWRLGKVVDLIAGKDKQVRQLLIKTSTGLVRRPTSKFALLDILPQSDIECESN